MRAHLLLGCLPLVVAFASRTRPTARSPLRLGDVAEGGRVVAPGASLAHTWDVSPGATAVAPIEYFRLSGDRGWVSATGSACDGLSFRLTS
jgi:hypothetical protein